MRIWFQAACGQGCEPLIAAISIREVKEGIMNAIISRKCSIIAIAAGFACAGLASAAGVSSGNGNVNEVQGRSSAVWSQGPTIKLNGTDVDTLGRGSNHQGSRYTHAVATNPTEDMLSRSGRGSYPIQAINSKGSSHVGVAAAE
jgi:hypothetical protein